MLWVLKDRHLNQVYLRGHGVCHWEGQKAWYIGKLDCSCKRGSFEYDIALLRILIGTRHWTRWTWLTKKEVNVSHLTSRTARTADLSLVTSNFHYSDQILTKGWQMQYTWSRYKISLTDKTFSDRQDYRGSLPVFTLQPCHRPIGRPEQWTCGYALITTGMLYSFYVVASSATTTSHHVPYTSTLWLTSMSAVGLGGLLFRPLASTQLQNF